MKTAKVKKKKKRSPTPILTIKLRIFHIGEKKKKIIEFPYQGTEQQK